MCRFTVITHTYSLCKLKEVTEGETLPAEAGILKKLTDAIIGSAPAPENPPPVANDHGGHLIFEKGIIQCTEAVEDESQRRIPIHERKCRNIVPLRESDGVPINEAEVTKRTGACPACQAGEDAIKAALSKESIVSFESFQVCDRLC